MGYGGASNYSGMGGAGYGGGADIGSAMTSYSNMGGGGGGGGGSFSYIESGPPMMESGGSSFGNPNRDPFATASSNGDPFAPMGQSRKAYGHSALKWDERTGKVKAGTDIGEEPLPGNRMTDEECRRHGLPKGSLWLDEDAAKSKPHPLFDPNRDHISWDELPTGLSEAMATAGNGVQQQRPNHYGGQVPESDSQPRALSLGHDESRNQLISLQHQLGGAGRLGNIPIGVLANMTSGGPEPSTMMQSKNFSASNLLNINNEQSRMMSGLHADSSSSIFGNTSSAGMQQQAMNIFGTPSMDASRISMQAGGGWVGGGPGQSYFQNSAPSQARSPAMQPLAAKSPGPMFAGAGMGGAREGGNNGVQGPMGGGGSMGMMGGAQSGMNTSMMGMMGMGNGGMNSMNTSGASYGMGANMGTGVGGGYGMGASMGAGGGGGYSGYTQTQYGGGTNGIGGGGMGVGMGGGGIGGMGGRGFGGFGPGRQV